MYRLFSRYCTEYIKHFSGLYGFERKRTLFFEQPPKQEKNRSILAGDRNDCIQVDRTNAKTILIGVG